MRLASVLLALCALFAAALAAPPRPIIGILTLPCTDSDCRSSQSFPASYVKFVEAAGARVVPIPYNATAEQVIQLFSQLNGVLFTGGDADLTNGSPFFEQVKFIFGLVFAMNQAGTYLPLWGTCLGFEAIVCACSGDPAILSGNFDSWNYPVAITPTPAAASSRMFMKPYGSLVLEAISTNPYPFHNHRSGVTPTAFAANANLTAFFNVLATNVDRGGRAFVSIIEGKSVPVYATQFHPEKNMFEWNTFESIDHSFEAVHSMQHFANFFVNEARQNSQTFVSVAAENAALIYNYAPAFTGLAADADFVQTYYL